LKSPIPKIQSPSLEGLIEIEPLIAPEANSVPPLASRTLETEILAVLPSGASTAPEVRDATSVAASQVAWTGDPDAMMSPYELACSNAPELYAPLELEEVEILHFDRDDLPCFNDESYADLPRKGRLRSMFYTSLVYPPARPFEGPLPPVLCAITVVAPLPPWGEGVLFPDVPSADTLVSPVGKTHHRVNSVHWSSVRWTKEYAEEGEPESNEQEEPEEVQVNWTHGLPFENSPKPSKRKLRLSIQKQLKSHRRALKRYRRNLRVDKKGTAPSAAEESPAQDNPPHEPVNPSEDTSTPPAASKPDSDSDEEISDSDSSPKEDTAPDVLKNLREDLRKAILACLYYRNKYLKRLRLIALNARKHLIATPTKRSQRISKRLPCLCTTPR
jgi:hypothetical protein